MEEEHRRSRASIGRLQKTSQRRLFSCDNLVKAPSAKWLCVRAEVVSCGRMFRFLTVFFRGLRLRRGHTLPGELIGATGKVDDDSEYQVTVDYRFLSPDGRFLTGTTTRPRNDLKGQSLPTPGTPLAVSTPMVTRMKCCDVVIRPGSTGRRATKRCCGAFDRLPRRRGFRRSGSDSGRSMLPTAPS